MTFKGTKKGIFTIQKLLIGLTIFSLFVVILGGLYVSMVTAYDVPVSEKYQKNKQTLERMTNISTDMGTRLQSGKLTETNPVTIAADAVYSLGQILLNSIKLPYEIIAQFAIDTDIPIHPAFLTALTSILVIVVVFGVFGLLGRWQA